MRFVLIHFFLIEKGIFLVTFDLHLFLIETSTADDAQVGKEQ